MADAPKEEKKVSTEHINLKVVSQDQNEVYFKIKKTTPLRKLMEAYCEKQGKQFNSIRFLFDGERIRPEQTPQELEMEENDTIDVMVEQVGGSF